jgi:hypothetical protein
MTLRDRFAEVAMRAIADRIITTGCRPEYLAGLAYQLADAMLVERSK